MGGNDRVPTWEEGNGVTTAKTTHITNSDLKAFAARRVNLSRDEASAGRDRVRFLREGLARHISDNPEFSLVKMLHAGSVAKGTALANLNDMDVAVYVRSEDVGDENLVLWMTDRLREVYGDTIDADAVKPGTNCPTITFASGFAVDVVPVLYEGDEDDKGYLVAKDTGERLLTSIPLHLKFIRTRKEQHPDNLAQVVRYLKWWIRLRKRKDESFKFKSFMAELIVAHLADSGMNFGDHIEALTSVFAYIVDSGLAERVSFTDYYTKGKLSPPSGSPIEIFDPVNPENNVASRYTRHDRDQLVDTAEEALDAITEAGFATTKGQAVDCWQLVLGTTFRG